MFAPALRKMSAMTSWARRSSSLRPLSPIDLPNLHGIAVGKVFRNRAFEQRRWPSASTAANAVAFSTGTLLQRRLCTSGPSVSGPEISGPEISGPEISGPEISGPERAVGRQASGLPPSLTQKLSPAGDGSSLLQCTSPQPALYRACQVAAFLGPRRIDLLARRLQWSAPRILASPTRHRYSSAPSMCINDQRLRPRTLLMFGGKAGPIS